MVSIAEVLEQRLAKLKTEFCNTVNLRKCDYKKVIERKLAPISDAVHDAGSYINSKIKRTRCIICDFGKSCMKKKQDTYKQPFPTPML